MANMGIISSSNAKQRDKVQKKHVRFDDPEEYIADCCIIFDKIKDCKDTTQEKAKHKDTNKFSAKR